MGTDINGWVEIRPSYGSSPDPTHRWTAVIQIGGVVGRSYDMFSLLFGVTNYAKLPPLAECRDLPGNLSLEAENDYLRWETFATAWILWSDIQKTDWQVDGIDGRPRMYKRQPDGSLVPAGKSAPKSDEPPDGAPFVDGATWERDGYVYKIERISRADVMSSASGWRLLFDLMSRLAEDFGDDNVRLVVWFDR